MLGWFFKIIVCYVYWIIFEQEGTVKLWHTVDSRCLKTWNIYHLWFGPKCVTAVPPYEIKRMRLTETQLGKIYFGVLLIGGCVTHSSCFHLIIFCSLAKVFKLFMFSSFTESRRFQSLSWSWKNELFVNWVRFGWTLNTVIWDGTIIYSLPLILSFQASFGNSPFRTPEFCVTLNLTFHELENLLMTLKVFLDKMNLYEWNLTAYCINRGMENGKHVMLIVSRLFALSSKRYTFEETYLSGHFGVFGRIHLHISGEVGTENATNCS